MAKEVINDEELNNNNNFCLECDNNGAHYCDSCGKPILKSKYSHDIGGLICKECQEKHKKSRLNKTGILYTVKRRE